MRKESSLFLVADSTQVNAWLLEEEEYAQTLLPTVLNANTFGKTSVWIVLSMSRPWNMMRSLEKWTKLLSESIDKIKVDPVVMKQHCEKCWDFVNFNLETYSNILYFSVEKRFKGYVDPSLAKSSSTGGADMESTLPLAENALTHNLGLEIVVVVTKVFFLQLLADLYFLQFLSGGSYGCFGEGSGL